MNETKRKPIPKAIRLQVYEKCHGHCGYCGCELEYKNMQVDHMHPLRRGGTDDFENLLPSCKSCNHYKSTLTVEEFRGYLGRILNRLKRDSVAYNVALRFGLIEIKNKVITFYFEKTTAEQARNAMQRLNRCFPGCFINERDEFIAHGYANQYFSLENVNTELDLKCKVLECLSRGCCKTEPYWNDEDNCEFHSFMLKGVNNFLGTNFTMQEMEVIYQFLGNSVRHDKTIEFVRSGYQMDVLHKDMATT